MKRPLELPARSTFLLVPCNTPEQMATALQYHDPFLWTFDPAAAQQRARERDLPKPLAS